jgi:hypothetical protein
LGDEVMKFKNQDHSNIVLVVVCAATVWAINKWIIYPDLGDHLTALFWYISFALIWHYNATKELMDRAVGKIQEKKYKCHFARGIGNHPTNTIRVQLADPQYLSFPPYIGLSIDLDERERSGKLLTVEWNNIMDYFYCIGEPFEFWSDRELGERLDILDRKGWKPSGFEAEEVLQEWRDNQPK